MFSVFFVSFEKYELQMRKKFSTFFFINFFAQKTKSEKKLTPILTENVAYETLVNYTKPWTLHLILVLRKNFSKIFSSLFYAQKAQSGKFLTSFFSKNVAYETLVYYTKPWTLYLVSVLRNKGRKTKHSKNLRFFKTSFQKKTRKPTSF